MLRKPSPGWWCVVLSLCIVPLLAAPARPIVAQTGAASLQQAFAAASGEFNVPLSVLLSVSYNLSRWESHGGAPSVAGGYGPMHLTQLDAPPSGGKGDGVERAASAGTADPALHTLDAAARLLGANPESLKRDVIQNIRGGAALLAAYARDTVGSTPANEADWYGAAAAYTGSPLKLVALDFADSVYATMQSGASRTTSDGQTIAMAARNVKPNKTTADRLRLRDPARRDGLACPSTVSCQLVPAAYEPNGADPGDYGNYDLAARPADGLDIRYIVIHNTEISYATTLAAFQNPLSYVSSHYVIRSSDGLIAQMVDNNNVAWHAGNWYINGHSIGIEHEGVAIEGATWYTEQMYRASARLVRWLALRYNIPLDRAHIIGHDDIPGPTSLQHGGMHWDPGPFWDWGHYMALLGAPYNHKAGSNGSVVTINPDFATNRPYLTYCYSAEVADCRQVPPQPANFVYLRTAPDPNAPLIGDPYIGLSGEAATRANNWANKAVTGQQFYRFATSGDWDGIYFGGQQAWFLNPSHYTSTAPNKSLLITPRASLASIPVYGRAYPEAAAYPPGTVAQSVVPLERYRLPAGQIYVAQGPFTSDYYWAPTYAPTLEGSDHVVVKGQTEYYQIFFNHRIAFVQASDVEVVGR